MTMELGLGVVLVALYVSALAMVVLLGLELTPSRRINPPQLDSPSNRQTNARRGFTREDDVNSEGARPSSLIPYYHHKPDRIYLLQLRYAVEIANEETVRKYGPLPSGGLPVTDKRKVTGKLARPSITIESHEEDEAMKLKQMAAAAALAAGAAACNSPTPAAGLANATAPSKAAQVQKTGVIPAGSSSVGTSTNDSSAHAKRPVLGPEYKKISSFVEFRKKLIADGWKPLVNPHCLEEMVGVNYKDYCSKYPGDITCRACSMVPEIFIYTSQGYLTTRYVKDGTPLYVGAYGDIQDLDEPGRYGLDVDVWDYKQLTGITGN